MTRAVSFGDDLRSAALKRVEAAVGESIDGWRFVEEFEVFADAAGSCKRLRGLVFDLAIQGRLSGEPSSDLGWTDTGGTDGPATIPTNWRWVTLGDVTEATAYGTSQKAHVEPRGVPVLRMNNVQDGRLDTRSLKYVPEDTEGLSDLLLAPGDLLFNRTNSYELVGKMAVFRENGRWTFASYLIRVRLSDQADPAYVNLYFGSSLCRSTQIEPYITKQTNQANFNGTKLKGVLVPLPPLAEQKRIVAKVDQLMGLIDELEAKQTKKRDVQTRFRTSALDALTKAEGPEELAATWKRVTGNFEVLFERVEGVQVLRQTVIDLAVAGVTERDGSGALVTVRDIVADTRYGTARKCHRDATLTPVLRIPNVVRGVLDIGDLKYTKFPANELAELRLRSGDVLVVRSNGSRDLVGRACIVDERADGFTFAGYLIRVRLRSELALPEWFQLGMQSSAVRRAIEGPARTTTGVHNVNTTEILSLSLPLPPLAEQKRIVAKVEALMKLSDELEAKLRAKEQIASKLVEAVVKELVAV